MTTSISVALCTYNGAAYLDEQLKSLANQTLLPDELVVCDDRSDDETISIVASFAKRVPFPVKVQTNSVQLGYRRNFQLAASLCSSGIIAFCDQDDIWNHRKLEVCANTLAQDDVLLVFHQAETCDKDGRKTGTLVYDLTDADGSTRISSDPWFAPLGFTEVFKSSLLDNQTLLDFTDHFEGGVIAHDHLAYISALSSGRVAFVSETLALYRQHGKNVAGIRPRYGLKAKYNYLMKNRADDYLNFYNAATERAGLINTAMLGDKVGLPFLSTAMVSKYIRLASIYKLRARLYSERNIINRASIYAALLQFRSYDSKSLWSVPLRNILRDVVLGVVFHRWLKTSNV